MTARRLTATLFALIWSAMPGAQTASARPPAEKQPPGPAQPLPASSGANKRPAAPAELASNSTTAIPALGEVRAAQPLRPAPSERRAQVPDHNAGADPDGRIALLRRLVAKELARPPISRVKVSLLAWSLAAQRPGSQKRSRIWPTSFSRPASSGLNAHGAPPDTPRQLVAVHPNALRVPASNAKLFATTAAATLLRDRYSFFTELSVATPGGPLYVRGSGDPLFDRDDLARLVDQLASHRVDAVRGIVIDDSKFGPGRLAPGFEKFSASSPYRPPSGALNLDGNILRIRVSAHRRRKRPRVDVYPASEYVKVRKLIRYGARSGRAARRRAIRITTEPEDTRMWVVVGGSLGARARAFTTRRPVADPSLNFGWALRRALEDKGIQVNGAVWRGRQPAEARSVARLERPLQEVLRAANGDSDNLAAETLVRAMANVEPQDAALPAGSWQRGLRRMHAHLRQRFGVSGVALFNGSGLHRNSTVTASALCTLLRGIHSNARLRQLLLPTLALAGKRGTLARRLRGSQTGGQVYAKTGTLSGVFALSGLITPDGPRPLAFSLLVNGTSRRQVRRQMDRIVTLLARYARNTLPQDSTRRRPLLAAPAGAKKQPAAPL